jgi:propionyl-CoA carboxylase alpha chain
MWEAALAAARAVEYVGVGTVEYLVDESGFYFLEMNTRLQVEHGVTELVTGRDLVGLQLLVASGRALPFGQDDVTVNGHAVEVRLCAERPREDYRPTPGTATHVRWPEGPGLRVDRAIESGSLVSPAYDSLVAKLMAHGGERDAAIARLSLALCALELDGLETNRDLLAAVLDDAGYRAGEVDVPYLERRTDLRDAVLPDAVRRRHGAAAAFALLEERAAGSRLPVAGAGWRNVGRALHADRLTDAGGTMEVRTGAPGEPARMLVDDEWRAVGTATTAAGVVDLLAEDGLRRRYRVRRSAHAADVNGPEGQTTFALATEDDLDERGGTAGECRAPLPGAVTKVLVVVGDTVAEGDGLVVLEAMKMEHTLRANGAGTVAEVHCAPGQQVDVNDLLVTVVPA